MTVRVLAAEDSPTQAALLMGCLEAEGFVVTLSLNGVDALARATSGEFDIVVSDVVMPEMGGYELCCGIKAALPNLPVILLTGLDNPLDVIDALNAGADNFLRKPYQGEELVGRINSVLRTRDLRNLGQAEGGLELSFQGKRFTINSDREQMLGLLVTTFEDLVSTNQALRDHEDELAAANKEIAARLAETETERQRLHGVLSAVPQAMAIVDPIGVIVDINDNLARLLGQEAAALRGTSVWDAIPLVDHSGRPLPVEHRALTECLTSGKPATRGEGFDVFLKAPDGGSRPVISRTAPVIDSAGNVLGAVGTIDDIGQLQLYDPVTGLPGHGILIDRLQTAIDDATRERNRAGVLVVAIDRFDVFRSSLDPSEASFLLSGIADELEDSLSTDEVLQRSTGASVGYLGNAEFAVILPAAATEADVIFVGEFLSERLPRTADIDGIEVPVTVSVAVGVSDGDDEPAALLSAAAASVRQRREAGGGVITSDAALHASVVAQLQKESELRRAIIGGEIVVHYQPQVQLRGGAPVGVEALARWEHPERGLLGAEDFIPLAIESGLILDISWQVLEASCRQVALWQKELPRADSMSLSVNVTPAQLEDTNIAYRVERILSDTGLDPTALVLEITEGSVMRGTRAIGERLAAIKALGAQVAIDDFGTGYSSLRQLRELPVDILKIDRGFVGEMCESPGDAAIVAGSIRLGRALGLEIVAEGVETAEQLVQLRVLGCELAQGYHFAKALSPSDLERWWTDQPAAASASTPGSLVLDDKGDDGTVAYLIHELRTPLVALLGFTQLLSEAELSHDGRELLDAIVRSGQELDERVNSVREARDVVEGSMTLDLGACDVSETVKTLVSDMESQLAPHPVLFEAAGDTLTVADRPRLVQAVTNLLTNAAKFAPGATPIDVKVEAGGAEVTVTVRDRGQGIPEHRRPELFRRFSRLGSRTKGMGIGLYLARMAAIAHGGDLSYEPAPGGGSIFSFAIPLRAPVDLTDRVESSLGEHMVAAVAAAAMPRPGGGPRQVLYIEDSPANAALVQRVADGLPDVALLVAVDGLSGIEAAGSLQPDLVLLDLHLPDLEGDEVLQRLRSDPRTAAIPVLIASADVGDRAGELFAAGANGVIRKPFDVPRLRQLLQGGITPGKVADVASLGRGDGGSLDPTMVAALQDLAATSPGGDIDDLIGTFEEAVTASLRLLQAASQRRDILSLAEVAHELAGTSANFGAQVVSRTCRELEQLVKGGDISAVPYIVTRLGTELDEAVDALRCVFPSKVRS